MAFRDDIAHTITELESAIHSMEVLADMYATAVPPILQDSIRRVQEARCKLIELFQFTRD